MPAQAGIQRAATDLRVLDSRLRGNDGVRARKPGFLGKPGFWAVAPLGALLLFVSGCGSSSGEGYRTITEVETRTDSQAESDESQQPAENPASSAPSREADPAPATESSSGSQTPQSPSLAEADSPSNSTTKSPGIAASPSDEGQNGASSDPIDVPLADSSAADVSQAKAEPQAAEVKLLVPENSFSVEGPGGALRITYDDFDLEKVLNVAIPPPDIVQHFPDWLNDLDGKRVRVRGFMYPTFQETDLGGFVLARDYGVCCFGPQGKIYHLVEVAMREGETTDYIHARPFDVVGEFHIRPDSDGEELLQLYQIEDAIVIGE